MGYFNYFIKCIIKKFVNTIFKPKGLLLIFIIIFVLYLFCGVSRADWTDDDINYVFESFSNITTNQGTIISQLSSIELNTYQTRQELEWINGVLTNTQSLISSISSTTTNISNTLQTITSQLTTVSNEITNIYNKLDENQKELLTELEEDNQAVLEELNMIRDAINGSDEEPASFTVLDVINSSNSNNNFERVKPIKIHYEPRYTYTVKVYYTHPWESSAFNINVLATDNALSTGFSYYDYEFYSIGKVPSLSTNYVITYEVPSTNPEFIYFNWGLRIVNVEVTRSIKGIVESLNDSNSLQQQQNQLQQEQNDFLSKPSDDSDVSVDSFNSVDSNDITSSGLTGVFNNIYSSITSWNSKNVNLPIPYTNKTITIPANYTESMLSSFGGNWIITFIHSIYYFIVARFMIYSITDIINSIKSGSILNTDSKNNITTDML